MNSEENELIQSHKNDAYSTQKTSLLSRRKFIQIGTATLAGSVVGGSILKHLFPESPQMGTIKASFEKPNKNPAFVSMKNKDGSLVCYARIPGGKILKHELNEIGAVLYQACNGKRTRKEIVLAANATSGKSIAVSDANQFLAELEKQNLIVTTGKVSLFYRTEVRYEKA